MVAVKHSDKWFLDCQSKVIFLNEKTFGLKCNLSVTFLSLQKTTRSVVLGMNGQSITIRRTFLAPVGGGGCPAHGPGPIPLVSYFVID